MFRFNLSNISLTIQNSSTPFNGCTEVLISLHKDWTSVCGSEKSVEKCKLCAIGRRTTAMCQPKTTLICVKGYGTVLNIQFHSTAKAERRVPFLTGNPVGCWFCGSLTTRASDYVGLWEADYICVGGWHISEVDSVGACMYTHTWEADCIGWRPMDQGKYNVSSEVSSLHCSFAIMAQITWMTY